MSTVDLFECFILLNLYRMQWLIVLLRNVYKSYIYNLISQMFLFLSYSESGWHLSAAPLGWKGLTPSVSRVRALLMPRIFYCLRVHWLEGLFVRDFGCHCLVDKIYNIAQVIARLRLLPFELNMERSICFAEWSIIF